MNLIAVFRGFDGVIGQDVLDNEKTTGASVRGNKIEVYTQERIVATAELKVHGKQALWHLRKGQRGKEIGVATHVEFYV